MKFWFAQFYRLFLRCPDDKLSVRILRGLHAFIIFSPPAVVISNWGVAIRRQQGDTIDWEGVFEAKSKPD